MEEANAYNQAKASIDSELATSMQQAEAGNSKLATSARRISQIDSRLPEIQMELAGLNEKHAILESQITEFKKSIASVNESKKNGKGEVAGGGCESRQVREE